MIAQKVGVLLLLVLVFLSFNLAESRLLDVKALLIKLYDDGS